VQLTDCKAIVVGASRGLGQTIATALDDEGVEVLAVARGRAGLDALARHRAGIKPLSLDAADEHAPHQAFEVMRPDILVFCGGATPPIRPIHEQTWEEFSRNWDQDVRASFNFCGAVLQAPLAPGSLVVLISSGAALSGSPLSGGYAAAKRMPSAPSSPGVSLMSMETSPNSPADCALPPRPRALPQIRSTR
jgi:NAD(P)-dependent dehydrogenase (short-subunit alcohol dehydrogenase family)